MLDGASDARWLELDDPFELMARAIAPPWGDEPLDSTARLQPAAWRSVECEWATHDVIDCPRDADTAICIHRLTLPGPLSEPLNASLLAVSMRAFDDEARQAGGAGRQRDADAASNIGGFHSSRDLCDWPAVQETGLCEILGQVSTPAHTPAQTCNHHHRIFYATLLVLFCVLQAAGRV